MLQDAYQQGVARHVSAKAETVRARRSKVAVSATAEGGDDLWQATVDGLPSLVAVLDENGVIVAANRAFRAFAEREGGGQGWLGSDYLAACEASAIPEGPTLAPLLRDLLVGRRQSLEHEYACHSGHVRRWFVLRAWRHEGPAGLRIVLLHEPVTSLRLVQEQVRMHTALLDEIDAAVFVIDEAHLIVDCNAGAEALYGYSRDEMLAVSLGELVLAAAELSPDRYRAGGPPVKLRGLARRKDGSTFTADTRVCPIHQPGSTPMYVAATLDVSKQEQAELALLRFRSYVSAVTDNMADGLYTLDARGRFIYMNRVAQEMLGWSIEELRGKPAHMVIHRHSADSMWHDAECPIHTAARTREVIQIDDDAFVRSDGETLPVCYTAAPFETDDGGAGCIVVFQDISARKAEETRLTHELEKLTWVNRVRKALREDRFVLYQQPIVDLQTGAIAQRELLLRMQGDPAEDGAEIIGPGQFLPVAEESGLITEIDRWVVERAAEIAADGTAVELNVSACSVTDPSFPGHVRNALRRTGAEPQSLVFEITETALITDESAARQFVERLHGFGCGVALDDFGTGYGGFTYLKHLPIDSLKIDIEFVRDLVHNCASRNVVEAVVGLARGFGLKTVAEGVEDEATLDLLRELGVDYAQGFHVGRPAPL